MSLSHRPLVLIALIVGATVSCAAPSRGQRSSGDTALLRQQAQRRAAFDSVVHLVNTDSAYKLWHAMLTAPDIRAAQLAMQCEYRRLTYQYGAAADRAINRMSDTLWKHDDPQQVNAMKRRLEGGSPPIGRNTCGTAGLPAAPEWLQLSPP